MNTYKQQKQTNKTVLKYLFIHVHVQMDNNNIQWKGVY